MSFTSIRATDLFPPEDDQRPQWLVVRSGDELLGIPIVQVRELVRPDGIRPVPGAPIVQAGIVNVRGTVVTVLDLLALRTGLRAVAVGSIVLLEHGARTIGLAVDTVLDVRAVDDGRETQDSADIITAEAVMPLDAVALCARHMP